MGAAPFAPAFRPRWLTAGGHRQTLLGALYRKPVRWRPPTEDLAVDAGDGTKLLLRASWQRHAPAHAIPALVIVHGLVGCDRSAYAVAAGRHAWEQGWHVVRMNLRGAGESLRLCATFHHAGQERDVAAALGAVAARAPRVAVAGFSVGGSLVLLTLGRQPAALPPGFVGAAAVSPPVDLAAAALALESPGNAIYQSYFVRNLCEGYRDRQRLRPDLYEAGRERGVRTVWEYDERITARYSGFLGAADYYARCSPGPLLSRIGHPTLILAAHDDPIVPVSTLEGCALPASGLVRREVWPSGGHVGFVGPTRAPGGFWAAERVVAFLSAALEEASRPGRP